LNNGKVTLRVTGDVRVAVNGEPAHELEVQSDVTGKRDLIKAGDLSFILLKRGERFGIRFKDKNSRARREFTGLQENRMSAAIEAGELIYQGPVAKRREAQTR
jgi:uncharacterized protein (DUF1684 family)